MICFQMRPTTPTVSPSKKPNSRLEDNKVGIKKRRVEPGVIKVRPFTVVVLFMLIVRWSKTGGGGKKGLF